jgi:hypothetical protein
VLSYGTGYYPTWSLWDVEQHTLLHEVGTVRGPRWLGVDDFFLHGSGQALGHPTQTEWLDQLPDVFTIPFLSDEGQTIHIGEVQTYHEVVGVIDISDDSTRFLLRLGTVALVVPVIYE